MKASLGFNCKFWTNRLILPPIKVLNNKKKTGRFFAEWKFLETDEWNTKMPLNTSHFTLKHYDNWDVQQESQYLGLTKGRSNISPGFWATTWVKYKHDGQTFWLFFIPSAGLSVLWELTGQVLCKPSVKALTLACLQYVFYP